MLGFRLPELNIRISLVSHFLTIGASIIIFGLDVLPQAHYRSPAFVEQWS